MAQNGGVPGLLTFSGHGSYAPDRGALLCPADIEKDLAKGIAVRDLSKSEALQKIRDRLTVVLDCCHSAPAAPASELRIHTALPHDATPEQIAADHADFDISERVLLAARPGQSAHQALLGKVWHGALTFALVTVAEQWKASQDPGTPGLHVSYKQLLKRVRKLHSALRMRQSTRLRVPLEKRKAIRALPFFGTQASLTVRKADAGRDKVQLTPDWFITILNARYQVVAQIITLDANSNGVTVNQAGQKQPGTLTGDGYQECWYVNPTLLAKITDGPLYISGVPLPASVTLDSGVSCSSKLGFPFPLYTSAEFTGPWPSTNTFPTSTTFGPFTIAAGTLGTTSLYMQLNLSGDTLTSVVWYLSYSSSNAPANPPSALIPQMFSGAGVALNFPTGNTNYYATSTLVSG